MLMKLNGNKTYLVMAALLAVVVLERGLGLDVPGVALGEDWMLVVMNAIISESRAELVDRRIPWPLASSERYVFKFHRYGFLGALFRNFSARLQ